MGLTQLDHEGIFTVSFSQSLEFTVSLLEWIRESCTYADIRDGVSFKTRSNDWERT